MTIPHPPYSRGIQAASSKWLPLIALALFVFSVVLLSANLVFFLHNNWARATFPYTLENGEGMSLRWAMLLADGEPLFRPLKAEPPFVGCNYPPAYLWLGSRFLRSGEPSLRPLRMISLVSVLLLGGFAFGIARRLGSGWVGAVLAPLLFYAVPHFSESSAWARVDWMANALGFGGLLLVWPGGKEGDRPRGLRAGTTFLGLFALALATFTKQSMIVAPTAWCLWILWRRREQWYWILVLFLLGVLIHGLATLVTKGRYFLWVGPYTSGRFEPRQLVWFLGHFPVEAGFLLVVIAVCAAALLRSRGGTGTAASAQGREGFRLFFLYLGLSGLSLLSTGRRGASMHYAIEFILLLSILAGVLLDRCASTLPRHGWWWAICAVVFSGAVLGHGLLNASVLTRWEGSWLRFCQARDRHVLRALKKVEGPVLAEDLFYSTYLNKPLYIENPFLYFDLARRGALDPSPVIEDLRKHRVSVVFLDTAVDNSRSLTRQRFTSEALETVERAYPECWMVGGRFLYFPDADSMREARGE